MFLICLKSSDFMNVFCTPIPIPNLILIPSVSKSLLPGGQQIRKNTFVMIFYDLYEKSKKEKLPGGF